MTDTPDRTVEDDRQEKHDEALRIAEQELAAREAQEEQEPEPEPES
jgi:hypothetical protein